MLRQTADVMVALDRGSRATVRRKRFDDVRIQSALGKELYFALLSLGDILDGTFEDLNEFMADNFTLLLRIRDAFELSEKSRRCVNNPQVDLKAAAEHLLDLSAFA